MKKLLTSLSTIPAWLFAFSALAQVAPPSGSPLPITPPVQGFQGIINFAETVTRFIAIVFVALAIILFLWAAFLFLTAGGNEERQTKAKQTLLWAIIGIVVALFAFGIFTFVRQILERQ